MIFFFLLLFHQWFLLIKNLSSSRITYKSNKSNKSKHKTLMFVHQDQDPVFHVSWSALPQGHKLVCLVGSGDLLCGNDLDELETLN